MTLRGQGTRGPGGVPLDTSGFPSFLWPVGFDPTVAPGVAAPVGSIGMLADGTAGWVKWYDGGDTGWVSFYDLGLMQFTFAPLLAQAGALGTLAAIQVALSDLASKQAALDAVAADQVAGARGLTQVSDMLGTPAAIYDVGALACDTKGGLVLEMALDVATSGGISGIGVRVNGSTTTNLIAVGSWMMAAVLAVAGTQIAGQTYADLANAGDHLNLCLEIQRPESAVGHRTVRLWSEHYITGAGLVCGVVSQIDVAPAAGEIVSLGAEFFGAGGTFTAASSHVLTRRIAP